MCEEKRKVYFVGIGMGRESLLTGEAKECVETCDVLIGAARMLELFVDLEHADSESDNQKKYGVDKPYLAEYRPEKIKEFLEQHREYRKCAVVFSGDTGFYSGAKKLAEILEGSEVEIQFLPGISSVVYLAARLGMNWEDAKIVSIHGRRQNFIHAIAHHRKTFLLLGRADGEEICRKLAWYQMQDVRVYIGKRLSYEDEEIISKSGYDVCPEDFEGLTAVMIENPHPSESVCLHLPDDAFIRGKVPMTKEEVRTVSLAKLKLTRDAVLYDVGAGTGSVSVEAALQSEDIRVYAIEKNPEGVELIHQNKQKFCTDQVEVVEGTAPQAMEGLEAPTHVFLGGSSGNMKEILREVRKKNPQAKIVINAISLETLQEVMEASKEGLLREPEIVQMTVAKSRKLGNYHMMTGMNPIFIISDGE